MVLKTEVHIADIIRPEENGRPLVVEVQHSSMDEDTIKAREAYYVHMIWLFDFTPRIVTRGKHNKISLVDGRITYLKEKVSYLATLSCQIRIQNTGHTLVNNSQDFGLRLVMQGKKSLGDQCLESELTPIGGIFLIVHTRTKHWFQTSRPTYFDCGYGILRLLLHLGKGFALVLFMSYSDFCRERMPPLDAQVLAEAPWFHEFTILELAKLGIIPNVMDASEIQVSRNRVVIKGLTSQLSGMGLERGSDDWHGGSYYGLGQVTQSAVSPMGNLSDMMRSTDPLLAALNPNYLPARSNSDSNVSWEALFRMRLSKFFASSALEIDIQDKRGGKVVIIYCDQHTYGMKEKFVTLGMKYKRGGAGYSKSSKKVIKGTHDSLVSMIQDGSSAVAPKSAPKKEVRANYSGKVAEIEAVLAKLG
jgi:hypothetical protein